MLLGCFSFSFTLKAQNDHNLSLGFESNSQYYVDDSKTGPFLEPERFRSNNYLTVLYEYKDFYAGIQAESYSPMALLNYDARFKKTNLGLYYAGYKNKKFEVTLGHFYEQFGNGLSLRSWEDRQLGINNALRGARIKYYPTNFIELKAIYGKQRAGFEHSKADIFGFDSNIGLSDFLNLENSYLSFGLSYVGRNDETALASFNLPEITNVFGGRIDFSSGNFYSGVEFLTKNEDAIYVMNKPRGAEKGNAFFLNFGYTQKGLGVDVTLRRLENMGFYSDRETTGNIFNQYIINYLPGLTKQHDYLLTNIYVYQAQAQGAFNPIPKFGEIGGQIDFFYKFKKGSVLGGKYGTKIAVNASCWYGLKGEADLSNSSKFTYNTSNFGFVEKYFSDFSLEIRKKWSKQWSNIVYFVNQYYNKRYIEETVGDVHAKILVGETTYKIGDGKSLRFEAQHLWTEDDRKNWVGGTLECNLSSRLGFYLNDIYNYGSDETSEKIHYYNFGGNYTYGSYRFSLNYGRQRGGLICVGGVCRNVPENTGLTANISMSF